MNGSSAPARYRALWALLAFTLLVVVGFWGVRVSSSFGNEQGAAPAPVPSATGAPLIATVYSNIGPPNPATLCAELSPEPKQVTVESTSGAVLETLKCNR